MGVSVERDAQSDIQLAMDGGATFVERLQNLAKATDAYVAALQDLKLGKSAKEAFEDADRKHAAALEAQASAKIAADAMLETARQQADAILKEATQHLEDARKEASLLSTTSKRDADALLSAATAKANEAKSYSDKVTSEALAKELELNKTVSEVEAERKRVAALAASLDAKKKALDEIAVRLVSTASDCAGRLSNLSGS